MVLSDHRNSKGSVMADFSYELSVDGHRDNFYIIKKEGVKFAHIFLLDEAPKVQVWSVWVGRQMVARKKSWIEAWMFVKQYK